MVVYQEASDHEGKLFLPRQRLVCPSTRALKRGANLAFVAGLECKGGIFLWTNRQQAFNAGSHVTGKLD